jgi:hypothetical protein
MISRLCHLMHVCFTASILLSISGTPAAAQDWTTINKDYSNQRYDKGRRPCVARHATKASITRSREFQAPPIGT